MHYCFVVGGAIEVIVDEDALRDASEFHPDLITTEVFAESLLSASQLQSYPQNCDIDVLLNSIGNLMLIFNAKTRSDARACYDNALVSFISPHNFFVYLITVILFDVAAGDGDTD